MFLHLSRLSFLISEKSCRKIWWNGKSDCIFVVDKKRRAVGSDGCCKRRTVVSVDIRMNDESERRKTGDAGNVCV